MTNLKEVERKSNELNNDILEVQKELKKIQAAKFRLKRSPGRSDYESKMTEVLKTEELLKQVRQLLCPREKPVTMYEQSDVDTLDYDEVVRAIQSIQSKKTLTRWLTTEDGNNDEYRQACKIERMLIERRKVLKPVDTDMYIRKSDMNTIIDIIESTNDISKERILELLKNL